MLATLRGRHAVFKIHLLLWALCLLPVAWYSFGSKPAPWALLGFDALYLGLIVYANLLIFIPRFLRQGSWWHYALVSLAVSIPYASFGIWVLEYFFDERTRIIYLIARFYFLILAFAWPEAYLQNQQRQRRVQELESQHTQMELTLLKAQVNPHFLFNTLNNLYALTLAKSPQSPEVVLRLSDLMRYMFVTAPLESVPLSRETEYLHHYVALERLRLNPGSEIHFSAQGDVTSQCLPPMLLIPFVENAFKHGVEASTGQVYVTIDLSVQGPDLFFVVENSKPRYRAPLNAAHPPLSTSIPGGKGLPNVQKRLRMHYPERHRLDIEESEHMYKITLQLYDLPLSDH